MLAARVFWRSFFIFLPASGKRDVAVVVEQQTMKTLIVMRHARTEPDSPDGDFARKLTAKGAADAAAAAEQIASLNLWPDRIVTSGAARAFATAGIVAARLQPGKSPTVDSRIYDAEVPALVHVVQELSGDCRTVVMVAHNPGVEDFVDQLAAGHANVAFTPAAFAVLDFESEAWDELGPSSGVVRNTWRPA